ncbi:MAG: hypothetical protein ACRCWR_01280 [Saezia sp.]
MKGRGDTMESIKNDMGGGGLEIKPFQGEEKLAEALQKCIIYACEQGASTMYFCDSDFALWPLGHEEVVAAMTQWARSSSNQRRLTVIAATYLLVEREHAVWKRWRQNSSHRVACLQIEPEFDSNLPCVFWSDKIMLSLQNKGMCVGLVSQEKAELTPMRLRLDELERCCAPAFPATTLGL